MSALTNLRNHCQRMATATSQRPVDIPGEGRCWPTDDAERGLWVQLAEEVDAYLTGQVDELAAPVPRVEQDSFDFGEAPA